MASSYAVGRVQAGEGDCVIFSRLYKSGDGPAVIYGHQSGGSAKVAIDGNAHAGTQALLQTVADAGFLVAAQDQGGLTTWGNTTAQARMTATRTWVQASAPYLASSGRIAIIGISMGAVLMMNWAKANPTLVSCMVGILPATDLTAYYVAGGAGRANIEAAWGVTYPDPLPAGADPTIGASSSVLVDIPYAAYYASNDDIATPAIVTSMAAAIGGTATNVGALGHTEAAIGAVDAEEVAEFIQLHAA